MSDVAYWLNVKQFSLYLPNDAIPFGTAEQWQYQHQPYLKIAEYKGYPVHLLLDIDENLDYQSLRAQLYRPVEEFQLFNRAVGLQHFLQTHRFCGRCGQAQTLDKQQIAMYCASCEHLLFPRISPCIIVAIRREHHILLAHHARHKQPFYTVLAGFVEVGETLEQAVHREVFEESGIKIKYLQYVASQAWSFPNSLMMGFIADYESGDIQVQADEIADAKWIDLTQPLTVDLPAQGTIARQLIELVQQQVLKENQ